MSKLESGHGLRARVTIELQDKDGKAVAWLCSSGEVGAHDPADVAANVARLAAFVASATESELAKAFDGSLILLDIQDVRRRKHIGEHLRKLAKELEGKTLYHPETSLRFYADEIDPSPEELARRVSAMAARERRPLKEVFAEFLEARKAQLVEQPSHVLIADNTGLLEVYPLSHRPKVPGLFEGTAEECERFAREFIRDHIEEGYVLKDKRKPLQCVMLDGFTDEDRYDERRYCVKCQARPRIGDIGKSEEYKLNPVTGECVHACGFDTVCIDGVDTDVSKWPRVCDVIAAQKSEAKPKTPTE